MSGKGARHLTERQISDALESFPDMQDGINYLAATTWESRAVLHAEAAHKDPTAEQLKTSLDLQDIMMELAQARLKNEVLRQLFVEESMKHLDIFAQEMAQPED